MTKLSKAQQNIAKQAKPKKDITGADFRELKKKKAKK